MEFNTWWREDPSERFWLEITDRTDLGVDLNAPQVGANGREQWHYSLIKEVRDGDIVFHYHRAEGEPSISAWSRAAGRVWEDEVVWAPHAGDRHEPQRQRGWRLALEGFHPLAQPVTFAQLRDNEDLIRVLESELEDRHGKPLYTPFETGNRPVRAKQAYLAKLPAELVAALPSLGSALDQPTETDVSAAADGNELGETYRRPDESVLVAATDPFDRDPSLVERALRSHAVTQNSLADVVLALGYEPRSPRADEPNFDLAWIGETGLIVTEVKSITPSNEERQLRLGLGQVLRYRDLLAVSHDVVNALLVVSDRPTDTSWVELCNSVGVALTWPPEFAGLDVIS